MINLNYNFEWDLEKAVQNEKKHKISFEQAASIFSDPRALTIFDDEHSINEDRWITIGMSNKGNIVVTIHTFKEEANNSNTIRIISSRKATKKEIEQYLSDII